MQRGAEPLDLAAGNRRVGQAIDRRDRIFRRETRFIKVSGATVIENHPHDIQITKESPNYTVAAIGGE